MPDSWHYRDSFLFETRLSFGLPQTRMAPKCDHHERMAEHWLEQVHQLSRGPYIEERGFTRDRFQLRGGGMRTSVAGREKPYGISSRPYWRKMWLAVRESFLAEWHRQLGTQHKVSVGGSRSHALLTGITA